MKRTLERSCESVF